MSANNVNGRPAYRDRDPDSSSAAILNKFADAMKTGHFERAMHFAALPAFDPKLTIPVSGDKKHYYAQYEGLNALGILCITQKGGGEKYEGMFSLFNDLCIRDRRIMTSKEVTLVFQKLMARGTEITNPYFPMRREDSFHPKDLAARHKNALVLDLIRVHERQVATKPEHTPFAPGLKT